MSKKLALISLLFASCSANVTDSKTDQPAAEPTQVFSVANNHLSVADTGLYGAAFLDELQQSGADIRLWNGKLIAGADTVLFPELDSLSRYSGTDRKTSVNLQLRRLNLTSVHYAYECKRGGKIQDSGSGIAMLNPGFYLASETDEDDADGTAYLCSEYISANAPMKIRLSAEPNAGGRKRARIVFDQPEGTSHCECPSLYSIH